MEALVSRVFNVSLGGIASQQLLQQEFHKGTSYSSTKGGQSAFWPHLFPPCFAIFWCVCQSSCFVALLCFATPLCFIVHVFLCVSLFMCSLMFRCIVVLLLFLYFVALVVPCALMFLCILAPPCVAIHPCFAIPLCFLAMLPKYIIFVPCCFATPLLHCSLTQIGINPPPPAHAKVPFFYNVLKIQLLTLQVQSLGGNNLEVINSKPMERVSFFPYFFGIFYTSFSSKIYI